MPEMPRFAFQRVQAVFTAHIRDPDRQPGPVDVPAERMQVYRELMYNNVESFLGASFPVLKRTLDDGLWHLLVSDFFRRHRSKTPYFAQIAEEFLEFLQQEHAEDPNNPPFLLELAHYEWVELALMIAESEGPGPSPGLLKDPSAQQISLSELAWPLAYRFPVHRIGPDLRPDCPPAEPTFLIVYRDREGAVRFLEVNAATYGFLDLLRERQPIIAATLVAEVAALFASSDAAAFVSHARALLQDLATRGIIAAT